MTAKPKEHEKSAIRLDATTWDIENGLDLLPSTDRKGYISYRDPGETGVLLKMDGTLTLSFPTIKECESRFEEITKKFSEASGALPPLVFEPLHLERYRISRKVKGKLADVAPSDLTNFFKDNPQRIQYEPKKISFEFIDPASPINFIKITFDTKADEEKLMLDITVESNKIKDAQDTINEVEGLIGK
jgi:hypothetical protein